MEEISTDKIKKHSTLLEADSETGLTTVANEKNLQRIEELRQRLKIKDKGDQRTITNGVEGIDFSQNDIRETRNSAIGKTTEKLNTTADSQIKMVEYAMLRRNELNS